MTALQSLHFWPGTGWPDSLWQPDLNVDNPTVRRSGAGTGYMEIC
jgi:hypothetical protein